MALPGKNAAFEFIRCYANRFSNSRMYQTIRVIRPQPQQPTPASILRDMPSGNLLVFAVMAGVGGSSLFYLLSKPDFLDHLTTPSASLSPAVEQEKRKLTAREKRFIKFASVEYDGQIYMTPQGLAHFYNHDIFKVQMLKYLLAYLYSFLRYLLTEVIGAK